MKPTVSIILNYRRLLDYSMKKTDICSGYCTLIYYVLDAPIGSLGKLMRRDSDFNRSKLFNSEISINFCVKKLGETNKSMC